MAISGEGLFREKVEVFLKEKYEKDCQGSCKGKLNLRYIIGSMQYHILQFQL